MGSSMGGALASCSSHPHSTLCPPPHAHGPTVSVHTQILLSAFASTGGARSRLGLKMSEPKASPFSLLEGAVGQSWVWGSPHPLTPGPPAPSQPCSCSRSQHHGSSGPRGLQGPAPPAPSPAHGWVGTVGTAQPPAPRLPPTFPASPGTRRGRQSQRRAVGGCVGGRWCFPSPGSFLPPPQPRSPALHEQEPRVLSSHTGHIGTRGQWQGLGHFCCPLTGGAHLGALLWLNVPVPMAWAGLSVPWCCFSAEPGRGQG